MNFIRMVGSCLLLAATSVTAGCASGGTIFGGVTAFEMNQRFAESSKQFDEAKRATDEKVDKLVVAVDGITKRLDSMSTTPAGPTAAVDPRDAYARRLAVARTARASTVGVTNQTAQAERRGRMMKAAELLQGAGLVNISTSTVCSGNGVENDVITGVYGEYSFRGRLSPDGCRLDWSYFQTPRPGNQCDAGAIEDAEHHWATYSSAQQTACKAAYGYECGTETGGDVVKMVTAVTSKLAAAADPWK